MPFIPVQTLNFFLCLAVFVPKELSHREAPVPQHRADQLSQVQPDMGNVDGHVVRLLQCVCKPEKKQEHSGVQNQSWMKTFNVVIPKTAWTRKKF